MKAPKTRTEASKDGQDDAGCANANLQERKHRRQEGLKKQRSGQLDDDVRCGRRSEEAGGYDAGCGEQVL